MTAAVSIRGLVKTYGPKAAVAGIDLDVPAGSFFGLVGPNGAGKTTTLLMCAGLLRPDSGRIELLGRDVWRDPRSAKEYVGVLPEGMLFFERLTGTELLTYTGLLRRMDRGIVDRRAAELLEVFGLADAAGKLVVDYSTGMLKKVGLAAALLHAPRLLFLDEPFEGVDPVSAHTIRSVLDGYTSSGGTIVFSSHVMELVERLCDTVAVMVDGQIAAAGPVDEVRGAATLEETFVDIVGGSEIAPESLAWLRS